MKLLQSIQGLFYTLTVPSSGSKSSTEVAQALRTATRSNRYRVRHVDSNRVERVFVITSLNRALAQSFVERNYGDPLFLSAVRLSA